MPAHVRAPGNGEVPDRAGRRREQPEERRRAHSRWASSSASPACQRQRQVHPGDRDALQGAGPAAVPRQGPAGRARRASTGIEHSDKVIDIDQSPIGRTPRSNPATYTDALHRHPRPVRQPAGSRSCAATRPGRFSFNVKGGRCEACQGDGIIRIEMQFLPDVYVPCEVCHGKRYNREALEIQYKGKSIADVLDMTVDEALEFFQQHPAHPQQAARRSHEVGLGYIKLGQPATTLSGGEAQRVKLSKELSRRATGKHALHPGRADHRPALRRHPASCWRCCTGWSTRATRSW